MIPPWTPPLFFSDVTFILLLQKLCANVPSRFVVFKKVSGGLAVGDNETKAEGRLKTSILALEEPGVSFGAMSNLVSGVLNGKKMQSTPALPNIKTRTKKLEESERTKRDRKKDQARQRSAEDKKSPPVQQTFAANDGTKEGRRLERERRRAEHNADNDNVPKTPEEIAEMEKRRRQRMEEEAAKWNIGVDDSSEEGGGSIEEDGGGVLPPVLPLPTQPRTRRLSMDGRPTGSSSVTSSPPSLFASHTLVLLVGEEGPSSSPTATSPPSRAAAAPPPSLLPVEVPTTMPRREGSVMIDGACHGGLWFCMF